MHSGNPRERLKTSPESRWTLWHAGAALVLTHAAYLIASHAFLEGERHPRESLARYGLCLHALTALVTVSMLRKRDLATIVGSDWGAFRMMVYVTLTTMFLGAVATLNVLIAGWFGAMELPGSPVGSRMAHLLEATVPNVMESIEIHHGLLAYFFVGTVVVALYEEILYRMIALDAFARHVPFAWAAALQAALFAVLHRSPALIAMFFVFALTLGFLRHRSGGIAAGILVHAIYNGVWLTILIAS